MMPVGRITAWASTKPPISSHPNPPLFPAPRVESSSSNFPGVAETKMDLLTLDQNSPAWAQEPVFFFLPATKEKRKVYSEIVSRLEFFGDPVGVVFDYGTNFTKY